MGAFEFTALDARGRSHKGVLEGDAPRQIRQQLRDKGWTPLSVDEVSRRSNRQQQRSARGGKVSATDLAVLTRQLATLVESGTPLDESLYTVSQQTEKARLQSVMIAVRSRVKEGHSLAEALGEFPNIFPELYRATVAAGESTGHLDAVLTRLADYTESRQELLQKITQALIYPIVLSLTALAVVALLLGYVVPQVVGVFQDLGQTLPFLTRALIATSDFIVAYGVLIFLILVVAGVIFKIMLKRDTFRHAYHRFLLGLPLLNRLVKGINTARFSRTFSILSGSGVPVLESLRIAAAVIGNLPMREAVQKAARRVREGAALNVALDQSGYFPPLMIHLLASGEASGKLEDMLERAATSQERDLENRISTLMKLFEPLVILVMGVIVLIIVLAILLPIFDLNQLVK